MWEDERVEKYIVYIYIVYSKKVYSKGDTRWWNKEVMTVSRKKGAQKAMCQNNAEKN